MKPEDMCEHRNASDSMHEGFVIEWSKLDSREMLGTTLSDVVCT